MATVGSPSHLCRRVVALIACGLLLHLHKSEVRQWGLYLVEILLELTLGPISTLATNELLRERSSLPRAGHIYTLF